MNVVEKSACLVCGSSRFEEIHSEPVFFLAGLGRIDYLNRIVLCSDCGMVFSNPQPAENELINYYERHSIHEVLGYDPVHMEEIFQFLQGRFPAGFRGKVLEIGCANAHRLRLFNERGWMVSGIEPNEQSRRIAKEQHGIDILQAAFSPALLADAAPFDLIILSDVIEHVSDPAQLIRDIATLLGDQGCLYLVTPNLLKPFADLGYFNFEHLNYFSPLTLTRLLADAGFSVDTLEDGPKLISTWRKSPAPAAVPNDHDRTLAAVQAYKQQFDRILERTDTRISKVAELVPAERLAVWGAGVHTSQLLSMTLLGKLPLHCFFDRDAKKHGSTLNGIPVRPFPDHIEELKHSIDGILISSKAFENAIHDEIRYLEAQGIQIFTLYHPG